MNYENNYGGITGYPRSSESKAALAAFDAEATHAEATDASDAAWAAYAQARDADPMWAVFKTAHPGGGW